MPGWGKYQNRSGGFGKRSLSRTNVPLLIGHGQTVPRSVSHGFKAAKERKRTDNKRDGLPFIYR